VAVDGAVAAEVRLYDRLFLSPRPDEGDDFLSQVNPRSLEVLRGCFVEPSVLGATPGSRFQFERQGYFAVDPDSAPGQLVFNKVVGLREVAPAKEAAAPKEPKEKAGRASTRPPRRSKAEYRAEARARDPELTAALERFRSLGVPEDEADVLSGDRSTVTLFSDA